MPFLKCMKKSYAQKRIESTKRNGLRNGVFSSNRKAIFKGYYTGQWKDDKKDGKGLEVDRHGWMYEGDWLCGEKHGYGVLSKIEKDGPISKVYSGNWVKGTKHGFGCNWYKNGDYYEGDFYEGKRHGYGRIWYHNCKYYQGMWKDDLPNGEGMLVNANGNRYEGAFLNGKRHGIGTYYHLNTGQSQRAYWEDDECLSSIVRDITFRQSATNPTSYPIPKCELKSQIDVLNPIREICGNKPEEKCRNVLKCPQFIVH